MTPATRRLVEAAKAVLIRSEQVADEKGYADCDCINWSQTSEREYETGVCPHQITRKAIAALEAEQSALPEKSKPEWVYRSSEMSPRNCTRIKPVEAYIASEMDAWLKKMGFWRTNNMDAKGDL
jgi:hypothetical protein